MGLDPISFRVGGGALQPVLLWEVDHAAAAALDWLVAPPVALSTLAITTTVGAPQVPSVWGTDGATGLVLDDDGAVDGFARYTITMADVNALVATGSRAATRLDSLIICSEWLTNAYNSWDSSSVTEVWGAVANNYNALVAKFTQAGLTRRIGYYSGGFATINSITPMRSGILEIGTDRAEGWSTLDVLTTDELPDPANYDNSPIQMAKTASALWDRSAGAVEWGLADSKGTLSFSMNKKKNDTGTFTNVRNQIWLRPGTPYEGP